MELPDSRGGKVLTVNNLSKNLGNRIILNNVNFDVNSGEIVGILGENGAGKTTLMRIISTLLKPDKGSFEIDGYKNGEYDNEIRKRIGILFGNDTGLYSELTGKENIEYFARLNGMSKYEARQGVEILTQKLECSSFVNKKVGKMSRGMKQKIAFARALVHNPSLVILDEPEAGLDFVSAKTVFDFMKDCRAESKAVLFSSHSMENIKMCSDRIVVLKNGTIAANVSMSELRGRFTDEEINGYLFSFVERKRECRVIL